MCGNPNNLKAREKERSKEGKFILLGVRYKEREVFSSWCVVQQNTSEWNLGVLGFWALSDFLPVTIFNSEFSLCLLQWTYLKLREPLKSRCHLWLIYFSLVFLIFRISRVLGNRTYFLTGFRAIFSKWHLYPSKTLIREKNARVWSVCSRQEQGNSRSYIAGHLWHSRLSNQENSISQLFVAFWISFPTSLISL